MNDSFLTDAQIEELDTLCGAVLNRVIYPNYPNDEKMFEYDKIFRGFCAKHEYSRAYTFDNPWFVDEKYVKVKIFNAYSNVQVYYYDIAKRIRVQKIKSIYE